jgi:hypothetical protein
VKRPLRIDSFFFDLNLSITIGIQAQSGAETDTVMPHMRRPFSWQRFARVRFADDEN